MDYTKPSYSPFVSLQDTAVDIPGKYALLVYSYGCNFKCPYCFNISYLNSLANQPIANRARLINVLNSLDTLVYEDHAAYLKTTLSMYDAIIFSGGEPLIHYRAIRDALKFIRDKQLVSYLSIQSTAYNPELIDNLIKQQLIDNLQTDIKTNNSRMPQFTDLPFTYTDEWITWMRNISAQIDVDLRTTIPTAEYIDVDAYITLINKLLQRSNIRSFEIKIIKFVHNITTDQSVYNAIRNWMRTYGQSYTYTETEESATLTKE